MQRVSLKHYVCFLALLLALALQAGAVEFKPVVLDPNYSHDEWVTEPQDIVRKFRAYTTSFDSGNGGVVLGVPEWVVYEIKPYPGSLGGGPDRPSVWMADTGQAVTPTDESYKGSKYDRGHMCPKYTAFRLGVDADWNTHTTLNACPQSPDFNRGIWKDLEDKIASWADTGGASIWVICGPVFRKKRAIHWIGDTDEIPAAVPHGFYKIVVRESQDSNKPDVLAFLYPHHQLYKQKGPHNHLPYLVSVDYIEKLTGLDFLTALPNNDEKAVEKKAATSLW